jgi:hypothetical protein
MPSKDRILLTIIATEKFKYYIPDPLLHALDVPEEPCPPLDRRGIALIRNSGPVRFSKA